MTSDHLPDNRLEQLVLASVALAVEPTLDRVLDRVVNIAADIIGARYAAIGVLGPDGRTFERFTTRGISAEERARLQARPHALERARADRRRLPGRGRVRCGEPGPR